MPRAVQLGVLWALDEFTQGWLWLYPAPAGLIQPCNVLFSVRVNSIYTWSA